MTSQELGGGSRRRPAGRDPHYVTAEPGPSEVVPRGRIQQISPPWTASPPPGHCNPGARIAQPGHGGRGGCQVIPPMSSIENPRRKPKVTRLTGRTTTNEHLSQFSDKSLRKSLSPRGRASPVRMTARRDPAVLMRRSTRRSSPLPRPHAPCPMPQEGDAGRADSGTRAPARRLATSRPGPAREPEAANKRRRPRSAQWSSARDGTTVPGSGLVSKYIG